MNKKISKKRIKPHFYVSNYKAFTYLELIIVVSLASLIGLLSTPFLSRFLVQSSTNDTYIQLISELRKAQLYATTGKQNGPWGVYYGNIGGVNKIVLYQGSSYASHNNTAYDESFKINPNVTVTGLNDINFAQLSGIPSVSATITISGSSNTTRTILINPQGIINYATVPPTPTPPSNWYNASWLYRQTITINHTQVSGTLTNFPVLINLPSCVGLSSHAQSNGNDILFTDSSGTTKISHEIENYNSSTGSLVAWVNVPTVNSTTDTTIYMYYGNPAATNQQNATGVWDSNYKGVWHFPANGSAPSMLDSTGKNTAINHGSTAAGGQINGAAAFTGSSSQYIDMGNAAAVHPGVTNVWTFETWYKSTDLTKDQALIKDGNAAVNGYEIALNESPCNGSPPGNFKVSKMGVGSDICVGTIPNDNNWHFLVIVYSTSGTNAYIDGALSTPASANTSNMLNSTTDSYLGSGQGSYNFLYGSEDEVRLSNISRSTNWITTEYNNQSSPSTFYTDSTEQNY